MFSWLKNGSMLKTKVTDKPRLGCLYLYFVILIWNVYMYDCVTCHHNKNKIKQTHINYICLFEEKMQF